MIENPTEASMKISTQVDSSSVIEPNSPKAQKNIKLWLASIGILIISLVVGYLFIQTLNKPTTNNNPVPTQAPIDESDAKASPEIASWQTYSNAKMGFSIDYPSDWTFTEYSQGLGSVFKPKSSSLDAANSPIRIAVMKRTLSEDEKQTFVEYVKTAGPQEIQNFQSLSTIQKITTQSGLTGYTITWKVLPLGGDKVGLSLPFTYFEKPDDKTVTIQLVIEDEQYLDIYQKMALSFKLIDPNLKTYTSSKLGISFNYKAKLGNQDFYVSENKNKICISYEQNTAGCIGQSIEVFDKNSNESLSDAIKRMFLEGKDPARCLVNISAVKNGPDSYVKAEITFPQTAEDYDMQKAEEDAGYCSAKYAQTNGVTYFLEDTMHSDKFVFFRIGQDNYSVDAERNWQDTIKFE